MKNQKLFVASLLVTGLHVGACDQPVDEANDMSTGGKADGFDADARALFGMYTAGIVSVDTRGFVSEDDALYSEAWPARVFLRIESVDHGEEQCSTHELRFSSA